MSGNSGDPIGVLTFGSEIGDAVAQEFSLVTHSQIALLANGQVVATTVPGLEAHDKLATLFLECGATTNKSSPREILLGEEHYFCSAGRFASLNGDGALGYLLLSSYERPLRALHGTQQILLLVSTLCIFLGTVIVWFLVRQATRPLRELHDSAEAVGKGDFSLPCRGESPGDECGELVFVFNQMTEKP